jgi:hypothetical protein
VAIGIQIRYIASMFALFPDFQTYLSSISRKNSSSLSATPPVFDDRAEPCILGPSGEPLVHDPFRPERISPLDPEVRLTVRCAAISSVLSRLRKQGPLPFAIGAKTLAFLLGSDFFRISCAESRSTMYDPLAISRKPQ